jgi:hypothetical protein
VTAVENLPQIIRHLAGEHMTKDKSARNGGGLPVSGDFLCRVRAD